MWARQKRRRSKDGGPQRKDNARSRLRLVYHAIKRMRVSFAPRHAICPLVDGHVATRCTASAPRASFRRFAWLMAASARYMADQPTTPKCKTEAPAPISRRRPRDNQQRHTLCPFILSNPSRTFLRGFFVVLPLHISRPGARDCLIWPGALAPSCTQRTAIEEPDAQTMAPNHAPQCGGAAGHPRGRGHAARKPHRRRPRQPGAALALPHPYTTRLANSRPPR